ncbi:MAG: RNA polymerase sigma factor [Saprospiraceae bacterium]
MAEIVGIPKIPAILEYHFIRKSLSSNNHIDKTELEKIFLQNYGSLIATGLKTGADRPAVQDAIQSLFLELWEKRDRLSQVTHLNAYLRKSLVRKLIRSNQQNFLITSLSEKVITASVDSYEDRLIFQETDKETRQRIQNALQNLPEQQLEVLQLRFFAGMSYDEIAELRGKSKQTIYNQIFSAIKKLKNALQVAALICLFQ